MAQYQYKPLQNSAQQIRLLEILSTEHGRISGSLKHFDLADAPPYIALSYTWGSPHPTRAIHVNRHALPIRQNLYDFFTVHGDRLRGSYIWADQICIDQRCVTEVNEQVQIMGSIYRNADRVIAWLGKCPDEIQLIAALDTMEKQDDGNVLGAADPPDAKAFLTLDTQLLLPQNSHLIRMTRKQKAALDRLNENPYWTRLWIIQELLLSREVQMLYGEVEIPLGAVANSYHTAQLVHQVDVQKRNKDEPVDWLNVMELTKESMCFDLRDKVYGIQSLLPSEMRVSVDYAKSIEEVYFDAVAMYELHIEDAEQYVVGIFDLTVGMGFVDEDEWYDPEGDDAPHDLGKDQAIVDAVKDLRWSFPGNTSSQDKRKRLVELLRKTLLDRK